MNIKTREEVKKLLSEIMDRIIKNRTVTKPFKAEEIELQNPFGFRLVPMEIWKGAKFERSFVTSLGQGVYEKVAKIVAEGAGAIAMNQYVQKITINTWRKEKIDEILSSQRKSQRNPNWNEEVKEVLSLNNTKYEDLEVRFDLYIKRSNGKEEFYSIKTVKPNLDQTEIAKRDMLYTKAGKELSETYFALPFNPAGEGGNYRKAHGIPYKLFNMSEDASILIGAAFWNKIGESENTYSELLEIFAEVGCVYSPKIRKDYLGLE
ncbi:TdeIII family type II restriction endonuclease [Clostridium estertheticum]|uniref:TdeIII family type II restriction endonuclease n=1 Tax=Clostridium estertheticum TaxID=238834 RepID=UPI001C6E9C74|nr:TdeIII family type II restriction endonuclease [Clostridium estertheticum]MBW9173418.1 TdeIII family type II restriction endonuclease [Clostridium estertheticum]WLC76579.1 TdeIII family type II restriction endonuclease [Clostridium estertheticum]